MKQTQIQEQQKYIDELVAGTYFAAGEFKGDDADYKKLIRQAKRDLKRMAAMSDEQVKGAVAYETTRYEESKLPGGVL